MAGGDFNKDLLGDSSAYFGAAEQEYSWAQPIPEGVFDSYDVQLVAPLDENDPVPSCRNADGPYHDGQYVLTVDGFLVTPMLPWTVPLFWIQALPTPITTRYR